MDLYVAVKGLAKVSAQLVAAIIFQLYKMVDVQIECGW